MTAAKGAMLRLHLDLPQPELDRYREAAARVPVRLVESVELAEALLTGNGELALEEARRGRGVLLQLRPDGEPILASDDSLSPAMLWRFDPAIVAIRDRLSEGKLGSPGLFRVHRWSPEHWKQPNLLPEVDLGVWLFGERPEIAYSIRRRNLWQMHLGFPGGGMALTDYASGVPGEGYDSVSLIGSLGAAHADDHHDTNLHFGEQGCAGLRIDRGGYARVSLLEAFVESVWTSRPFPCAMRDLRLAETIVREILSVPEGCIYSAK